MQLFRLCSLNIDLFYNVTVEGTASSQTKQLREIHFVKFNQRIW